MGINMSEIIHPNDPRVDAYISHQTEHRAEAEGVWAISQCNDRQIIRIGSMRGTYREAVAAMLSDSRAHWYAWGNGSVRLDAQSPPSYAGYIDQMRREARKAELRAELEKLERRP
jgi:hypothetical protein